MAESDPKIYEAIQFFEQMLQTMPADRSTLEFLALAYEQTDQQDRRRDILIRLADTLLAEEDFENATIIAAHLKSFTDYLPACLAAERVDTVAQAHRTPQDAEPESAATVPQEEKVAVSDVVAQPARTFDDDIHALTHTASSAEMDLVWLWIDNEIIPKDICMDVLHVLTDRPTTNEPMLVSALAIVDELHPELTDTIMEAMQRLAEAPIIPLDLFDIIPDVLTLLPRPFMQIRGVLPFATMANDMLVATLNPLSAELKQEIEARCARQCHLYLIHPKTWNDLREKLIPNV